MVIPRDCVKERINGVLVVPLFVLGEVPRPPPVGDEDSDDENKCRSGDSEDFRVGLLPTGSADISSVISIATSEDSPSLNCKCPSFAISLTAVTEVVVSSDPLREPFGVAFGDLPRMNEPTDDGARER